MPCDCSHMEPNQYEIESRKVCQLLVYVFNLSGEMHLLPKWVKKAAMDSYGNPAKVHEATALLCKTFGEMTKKQQEEIIYDGHNPKARRLANWWDAHKKVDERKAKKIVDKAKRIALVKILVKMPLECLTPEDKKVLRQEGLL